MTEVITFRIGEAMLAPLPNLQAGRPPLVCCQRLLIQYIHRYPPHVETVSSIHSLETRHNVVIWDPFNKTVSVTVWSWHEHWNRGFYSRLGYGWMQAFFRVVFLSCFTAPSLSLYVMLLQIT
jgi:hypothetical protein